MMWSFTTENKGKKYIVCILGNSTGETQKGLSRFCCSPGSLVNPLPWKLLTAKQDATSKRGFLQTFVSSVSVSRSMFSLLSIYFVLIKYFCVQV